MLMGELFERVKDSVTIKAIGDTLDEYMPKLEKCDYECFCDDMYELICGEILSEDKAMKLVKNMKPYGEKWTKEQVEDVLSGRWNTATKYYVMNMMYNDYHDILGEDTDKYIKISLLWLNDVDSDGGEIKTYRYATRV